MHAETIIPSEVKSERQNKCDVTYTWNPKKKKMIQMSLFIKQNHRQRIQTYDYQRGRGKEKGIN